MCGVITYDTWDYAPETTTTTTVTERVFDEAGNVVKETVTETVTTSKKRRGYNPYPYQPYVDTPKWFASLDGAVVTN